MSTVKPFTSDSPKADMIYGESGTGKTTQIARMARYVYRKTGKITRLISADPGGWKTVDPYIALGIVQPLSLLDEKVIQPIDAIAKLVQGFWPFDPETGEPLLRTIKIPNSPLDGKQVYDFTHAKAKPTAATWQKVGGMGIEGMHSISYLMQSYLSSNPQILSELAGGVGTKGGNVSQIKDGSDVFVQTGQTAYNYIQKKMYDFVRQSCDLPMEKVVWSSLVALYEVKDKEGNVVATEHYYPSILGKAALRATPQWFGMLMHMETVQLGLDKEDRPDKSKRVQEAAIGLAKTEVRAYLKDHTSARDGYLFKAKARVALETCGELPLSFRVSLLPETDKVVVHDLSSLYELEDRLQAKAMDIVAADLGITR